MVETETQDRSALPDLSGFQRDILVTLARLPEDRPYGLQVKAKLEEVYPNEINHGRLYPNLDTLVNKGLISKGELDSRTNSYELTRRGWSALTAYRSWVGAR